MAGGGIGRACALACAAEGAKVVVADIGVGLAGEDPTSEVAEAVVKEIETAGRRGRGRGPGREHHGRRRGAS